MKRLQARKCKDGWIVNITDNRIVASLTEAVILAKQNGLELRTKIEDEKGRTIQVNAD